MEKTMIIPRMKLNVIVKDREIVIVHKIKTRPKMKVTQIILIQKNVIIKEDISYVTEYTAKHIMNVCQNNVLIICV